MTKKSADDILYDRLMALLDQATEAVKHDELDDALLLAAEALSTAEAMSKKESAS